MASLTITIPVGNEAGAKFRALAAAIMTASIDTPDRNAAGASTVLTITENGASAGTVVVSGGSVGSNGVIARF
jgi:hypothetical protein